MEAFLHFALGVAVVVSLVGLGIIVVQAFRNPMPLEKSETGTSSHPMCGSKEYLPSWLNG